MKHIETYGRLAAWIFALAFAGGASAQLVPGKDYQLINPAQPTASGSKVEVMEFFNYACPACNSLVPHLRTWLKKKPADVEFRRAPVVFQDAWLPLTTAYHTFDAMGLVDKLHYELFSAIHERRTLEVKGLLRDQAPLFDWVAKQGVDRKQFIDVYNSFGVRSRTNRSIEISGNYHVNSTPTVVVNGKYLVTPAMAGSYERFFQVIDQSIALARKERAAAK
jgi:thiol:disulfide interchange protein DsbA